MENESNSVEDGLINGVAKAIAGATTIVHQEGETVGAVYIVVMGTNFAVGEATLIPEAYDSKDVRQRMYVKLLVIAQRALQDLQKREKPHDA